MDVKAEKFEDMAKELAEQVADYTRGSVYHTVHQTLLGVKKTVEEKRDLQWAWQLAKLSKLGLKLVSAAPGRVVEEIAKWVAERELDIEVKIEKAAREQGFKDGVLVGTKFGWAACETGATLSNTLHKANDLKP